MVVKLSDHDGQHKESDLPAGHLTPGLPQLQGHLLFSGD